MVQSSAICLSQCDSPVSTPCGHIFCQTCISEHVLLSNGFQSFCPTCREKFPIAIPQLQHLPYSFHQFILPSVRRVFLDTSPDPQVEDLKRRLKVAEDRFEMQSTSHALAIARLTQQLELEATRKRRENDRAALLEIIYHKKKYESLRDDFLSKSSSSSLSSVTIGAKRQRSGSFSDPDQERASPLPLLSRPPPMRSPTVTTPTMRPLRQPVDLSTFTRLREALEKARQTLQGPFPTFDGLPSDRT
ncbi:hypothetical protein ARMGADRAFT_1161401 [Armillaria gallica]|uniref:RING-type domain-containing protein n=1 Tax=Armillaria gallica TaxID=47427 RepID=A0A2H3EL40_ARMGA|nr:hypothetical protein ARMGADRAFT_1161401 [Armillaria gallica]